jgi:hypothetical protein
MNSEVIRAAIAYCGHTDFRPRYYANDHGKDTVDIQPVVMELTDGRMVPPQLNREGFTLVPHQSVVGNFQDRAEVAAAHAIEIEHLIQAETGADHVHVTGPGLLRFSERSGVAGSLDNSMPARFAHVDISAKTAKQFATQATPPGKTLARYAHFNVWRAISAPPQDVPLALCDARSVAAEDLIEADAIFDMLDAPEWSFEGWIVAHNPAHRWHWFSDMNRDEVIIFKTSDSDPKAPQCVPHVAFDHPSIAPETPARISIEMRAIALWFA